MHRSIIAHARLLFGSRRKKITLDNEFSAKCFNSLLKIN